MRGITSACVVIIFFGFFQGIMSLKPKLTPAQDEILIQEGDELTIQCEGEGRLQFSKQTNTGDIKGSEFKTFDDESPGRYKFVSNGTKKEDTGWYACAEEGVDIWNDGENIDHVSNDVAWIYVYVNSSKPFAVDTAYEVLIAVAGEEFVVPCRVTSPDLRVRAAINWGQTEIPADTKYDPKIGFILNKVGKALSQQTFECMVDGSDAEPASYTLIVIDPDPLKKPNINLAKIRHVIRGRNLSVDCEIDVPHGTMGFNMSWQVPKSVPKERLSIVGPKVVNHAERHSTWKIELSIENFEESDDGQYDCNADSSLDHVHSSMAIKSLDPKDMYYIHANVEGSASITANETGLAQWKIIIDSYPEELEWKWYKQNGQEIVTDRVDKSSRYSYSCTGIHHFFKILQSNIEDNGNYTIELMTEKNETKINLQLTVHAAPLVRMDEVSPFYMPGKSATFTCHTLGSPLPNVTWFIREYPDLTSKENSELKFPSNVSSKLGEKGSYHFVSKLDVKINTTTDITCRSCNKINCVDSTKQIFVSDVSGHFAVIDPGLVAEGDDVNVTCAATGYNFTDTVTWSPEDPKKREFNTSRISVSQERSNFTSQSVLQILQVKKSDGGKYVCRAVNKRGSVEMMEYRLIVHAAVAPHFNNNSMEESKIFIDNYKNGTERSMVMMCFAEGMPIPQISWYKDDQLLVESNQYTFFKNNSTLKIAFFHDGDSGRYVCKATNRIGTAERHVDIQIAGKSYTLLIGAISVFVVIIVIVVTYMGIRLHREKVLRRKLLDVVSIDLQEEMVRGSNGEDQTDLLSYDKKMDFLREQLNSAK